MYGLIASDSVAEIVRLQGTCARREGICNGGSGYCDRGKLADFSQQWQQLWVNAGTSRPSWKELERCVLACCCTVARRLAVPDWHMPPCGSASEFFIANRLSTPDR